MTPVTDPPPGIPTSWAPLLCIAIAALAVALGVLWRYYSGRLEAHETQRRQHDLEQANERQAWAVERERLRTEYETRHLSTLQRLYEDAREHEATARREYAENMEIVAAKAAEGSEKVAAVLNKIYDRYISPRRTPH